MRIALELETEGPRLAISQVPGRPNALRQSRTLHALGRHRRIIAADARRPSRALQQLSPCAHGSFARVSGNVPLLDGNEQSRAILDLPRFRGVRLMLLS